VLNGRLIALDGPALGLLWTPAHRPEQSPDVIDVIANAMTALDQLSDPRTSPQIRWEARGPGPLEQLFLQGLLGAKAQLGRPARCGFGPNRLLAVSQIKSFPQPDASPSYAELPSDLDRLISVLEKRDGP
jgi:hypothetical protein